MGSFSWTRADMTTARSNLTYGDKYKILIPTEFGGGYIYDTYFDYGYIFEDENFAAASKYVSPDGHVVTAAELGVWRADLYGLLAWMNDAEGLGYEGDEPPTDVIGFLKYGQTNNYTNRYRGIELGCYDNDVDALQYPLKLVSASCKLTYEECKGRSYGDPNQGFRAYHWRHRDYQRFISKIT